MAFVSYALAFPTSCLPLVRTLDALKLRLPNFLAVVRALHECNYKAVDLHLDFDELASLSLEVRARFISMAELFQLSYFKDFTIVASNGINEETLLSSENQDHTIDPFGIGAHFFISQNNQTLGCVFKLVEGGDKS